MLSHYAGTAKETMVYKRSRYASLQLATRNVAGNSNITKERFIHFLLKRQKFQHYVTLCLNFKCKLSARTHIIAVYFLGAHSQKFSTLR